MDHQHLVDIRGYIKQDTRRKAILGEINRSDDGAFTNNRASRVTLGGGGLRASQSNPFLQGAPGADAVISAEQKASTLTVKPSNQNVHDIDEGFHKLSNEEQTQLKKVLDVKEPGRSGIRFKYNKHLHQDSKYAEFLDESDDEDAFNSMPKTVDGAIFELDFKIDAYRD